MVSCFPAMAEHRKAVKSSLWLQLRHGKFRRCWTYRQQQGAHECRQSRRVAVARRSDSNSRNTTKKRKSQNDVWHNAFLSCGSLACEVHGCGFAVNQRDASPSQPGQGMDRETNVVHTVFCTLKHNTWRKGLVLHLAAICERET